MRFVVAIVAFVLAAAAIGLGVAQRTVLAGPASVSSSIVVGDAPLTIIDATTLNANAGTQGIELEGPGDLVLAYGRTADVLAWVGESSYNEIGWDAEAGELTTRVVSGSEPAAEVPSPVGSDLWLREFTGTDTLTRKINAPEGISVIIAALPTAAGDATATDGAATDETATTDGTATEGTTDAGAADADPLTVSITWPLDNSAPASGPLIVGGVVLLLGGLGAFLWALVHARGRRGPRRNTPKLPKRPKPPRLKPSKEPQSSTGPLPELEAAGRPRSAGRRRAFTATGAVLVGVLALTGCTVGGEQPAPGASPTPGFETPPIAVTKGQFASILVDVAQTVNDADAAADSTLAAERLSGAALALRLANYAIRTADAAYGALAPIPDETVEITLPQQSDSWPRSVFGVVKPEGGSAVGMMLTQETPRDNYKLSYLVSLVADVPDVPPTELGASFQSPTNNLGVLAPDAIAEAYGDILINDAASASYDLFDAERDPLREQIGKAFKDGRAGALPSSAAISFSSVAADDPVYAFTTNDNGQIVAVSLDDVETVTPVEAGAAINPEGQVKALSGKAQSTRGIVATYGVQLLLYVPPVSATDAKIVLLGYAHGLVSAAEIG